MTYVAVSLELVAQLLFDGYDHTVTIRNGYMDLKQGILALDIEGPGVPDVPQVTCIIHRRKPLTLEFQEIEVPTLRPWEQTEYEAALIDTLAEAYHALKVQSGMVAEPTIQDLRRMGAVLEKLADLKPGDRLVTMPAPTATGGPQQAAPGHDGGTGTGSDTADAPT